MSLKIYLSWVWFGPSCLGSLERWPSGQSQFIPGQRRPSAGCNTYCRDARAWERAMPKVRFAQSDLIRTKKPPGSSESFRAFFFSLLLIGNLKVLKTLESGSSLERSHSTLKNSMISTHLKKISTSVIELCFLLFAVLRFICCMDYLIKALLKSKSNCYCMELFAAGGQLRSL